MRILYIFSGSRKDKFRGTPGVDFPDTQFYGQDHFRALAGEKGIAVTADYRERDDALPLWLRLPGVGRLIGFRLSHLFMYFRTRRYDIVFGSSLLYTMLFRKIIPSRARYILLNIGLVRTLDANRSKPFKRRFILKLLSRLDGVVCVANVQKDRLELDIPSLKGKVRYVPLGVDTQFYRPVYEGRSDFILSAGRDNGRDYKTLVEAARLLPDTSFEIVCSRRNMEGIEDIPANVSVFYDLPLTQLYEKYRTARLMVISTHDDGFADGSDCSGQTVLLDSMACGLPVIASRKRYLDEYARDAEDILTVDCYDADGMVKAIGRLRDPGLRERVARAARDRVEREFSTKLMAEHLLSVFQQL